MAWWQATDADDLVDLSRVPGGDDHAARVRRVLDHIDHTRDLVDFPALAVRPAPPLDAVDRAEVAPLHGEVMVGSDFLDEFLHLHFPFVGIYLWNRQVVLFEVGLERPLVPDVDVVLRQVFDVAGTFEEPEQLVDDGIEVELLGGDGRKPFGEIIADLAAEDATRAGAGTVTLVGAVI